MSLPPPDTKVRVDKWLWAARFFKTRSLALEAINAGHIRLVNGNEQHRIKPAHALQVGETLRIQKDALIWVIEVCALSAQRGSADLASALYQETQASLAARESAALQRKAMSTHFTPPIGRPSKRDRRLIDAFREQH
ncbi:MAG: hypothetical protein RLZZ502_1185 [Pseudomonadota bacterium]|jgi:ribosome-associated heat shock protein Hsp15